jgi:hypothetical protein
VGSHSYTYAVNPSDDTGDPGQFSGEFGVVEGPPAPMSEELPRDGSEHYDGSRQSRGAEKPQDQAVAAAPSDGTASSAPVPAQEEAAVTISTAAPRAVDVQTVNEEQEADQQPAAAAVTTELLATTDLPAAVKETGAGRWWKVTAILSAGAALQAWHWRRLMKARARRHF